MSSTAAIPKPDDVERPSTGALRTLEPIDPSTLPTFDEIRRPSASSASTLEPIDPSTLPSFDEIRPPKPRPELSSYSPTLWQRAADAIDSLLPDDRGRASNERTAREIAARDGITVDQVYRSAGGSRPLLNPEGRPLSQSAPEITDILSDEAPRILPGAANAALSAVRSGIVPARDESLIDRLIAATERDPGAQDPNYDKIIGVGDSLGYSGVTMGASLGAAAAAAAATGGNPIVGAGAGMAASGAVSFRASKNEFLRRVRDQLNEQREANGLAPMEADEWAQQAAEAESAANRYGLWEAGPEAVSNLLFIKAFKGLGPLKGAAASMPAEHATETMTGVGQNRAELQAGLTEHEMTMLDAFRNQFLQTLVVTGAMGSAGAIGQQARRFYAEQVEPRIDPQSALGRAMQAELERAINNPAEIEQAAREQMQPPEPMADRSPIEGAEPVHAPGPLGRAAARAAQQQTPTIEPVPPSGAPTAEPPTGTIADEDQDALGADLTGLDADLAGLERRDPRQAAAELDARLAEADPGGRDAEQALIQAAMTELSTLEGPAAQARVEALKQELAELQARRAQEIRTDAPTTETPPVAERAPADYGTPVVGTTPTPDVAVELSPETAVTAPVVESTPAADPKATAPSSPPSKADEIEGIFDNIAQGMSEAAHENAVDRFKRDGAMTYRQPDAVQAAKQDPRYNTRDNPDGSVEVIGLLDPRTNEWVGLPPADEAAETPSVQDPPDIARQDGTPFPDAATAERARVNRRLGEEYAPVQTDGGWVLRQATPAETAPPPTPSITREPEGDEIVAIEDDPRLKNPDTREQVRALAQAAGWSEEGGRVIRDANGQVTGRTRWIPRYPFWESRPQGVTKKIVDAAVEKFEAGKPLTKAERAALRFLTDTATTQDWTTSEDLDSVAAGDQAARDLTELRAQYDGVLDDAAFDDIAERVATRLDESADKTQYLQELSNDLQQAAVSRRREAQPRDDAEAPGAFSLTGESQADLDARRQADEQRAREDAERLRAEESKRAADARVDGFNLSPVETNPEAQQATDRGQMGMELDRATARDDQWPVNDASAWVATENAPDGVETVSTDQQTPAQPPAPPARLDTDITRTNGQPFKDEKTARTAAKNRRLADVEPVAVDGGWVLRGMDATQKTRLAPRAAPDGGGYAQTSETLGTRSPDGNQSLAAADQDGNALDKAEFWEALAEEASGERFSMFDAIRRFSRTDSAGFTTDPHVVAIAKKAAKYARDSRVFLADVKKHSSHNKASGETFVTEGVYEAFDDSFFWTRDLLSQVIREYAEQQANKLRSKASGKKMSVNRESGIDIASSEIGADVSDRKGSKDAVLQVLRSKYQAAPRSVRAKNGDVISVSWSGIKHAMNAGLPTWQEAAAALHIESLIAQADLLEIRPDKAGRTDPKSTTLYRTAARFDGVEHDVTIFVRNHSDGNRYYDHVTIEKKNPAGLTGSESAAKASAASSPTLPYAGSDSSLAAPALDGKAALQMTDAELEAESAQWEALDQGRYDDIAKQDPERAAELRNRQGFLTADEWRRRQEVDNEAGRRKRAASVERGKAKQAARAKPDTDLDTNLSRRDSLPRSRLVGGQVATDAAPVLEHDAVEAIVEQARRRFSGLSFTTVRTESALPQEIQDQAEQQGATGQVKAVHHKGQVWVVSEGQFSSALEVEEAIAHEVMGHAGVRALFGEAIKPELEALYFELRDPGVKRAAKQAGVDLTPYLETAQTLPRGQRAAYLVDELLAHLQGAAVYDSLPTRAKKALQALWGAMRAWLRGHGLPNLARATDSDLQYLLHRMRQAVQDKASKGAAGREARFMFAGRKAKGVDLRSLVGALNRAKAGEDREAIRQETGWFQGDDGKWRFEINDAQAAFKVGAAGDRVSDILPEYGERPLGEILDHPALFAAYPELASLPVRGDSRKEGGSYDPEKRVLSLNARMYLDDPTKQDALSVLLHEIQHGIQHREGFAIGGSPEQFAFDERMDQSSRQEAGQRIKDFERQVLDGQTLYEITEEAYDLAADEEITEAEAQARIDQANAKLEAAIAADPFYRNDLERARQPVLSAGERYHRLAGEAEARNTQARQRMTIEQRRATPPSQTADVAADDVIVMFNGKEAASAPRPANAGETTDYRRQGVSALRAVVAGGPGTQAQFEHPTLGTITLDFGEAGNPDKGYRGGFGVSHILARRMSEGLSLDQAADTLVQVVMAASSGTVAREYGNRADVELDGHTAVLSKERGQQRENWVITGFRNDADAQERATRLAQGYAPVHFGSREQVGAAINSSIDRFLGQSDPDIRFSRSGRGRTALHERNAKIRDHNPGLWNKAKQQLRRQLAPGGLLPKDVFDLKITRDSQFEAIEMDARSLVAHYERSIKAAYGKPIGALDPDTVETLHQALAGDIDPNIPQAVQVETLKLRQYIDRLSEHYAAILFREAEELLAAGNIEGARVKAGLLETIGHNIGSYVHRSYRAFDDPKWPKRVPEAVMDAARTYLLDRYEEQAAAFDERAQKATDRGDTAKADLYTGTATDLRASAEPRADKTIELILKEGTAADSMEAFIRESKLGAKDLSILKRRKEIAPEIRALLGEYLDPRVNFAKSVTKMSRLIFNQRFLDQVKTVGEDVFLFKDKTRAPLGVTKLIGSSESYAPLAGYYTYPEIEQAFREALDKEPMADWYRAVVRVNGFIKYGKTVLAPTTAMRNWMSAFFFTVANGHFDYRRMATSVKAFKEYFGQRDEGRMFAYLRHLKQLGVVYDTPYAGEMMRLLQESRIEDWTMGRWGLAAKKPFDVATKFYQFGDDFWKIIGFENEKRALAKAKPGWTPEQVEREAAARIRNTYPTYSMTGRAVNWLRRFPLAGTFVSFPSEIIRTSGNIVRYIAQDLKDPDLRPLALRRLAGFAFVLAADHAAQFVSMMVMGVDDDEEEALRLMAAPWNRNSIIIPISRDARGNLLYIDASWANPYSFWKRPIVALLRDQPLDEALEDVALEMFRPFFGEDIAFRALREAAMNEKASGGRVFNPEDQPLEQMTDIAKHIGKAVQPGFVGNIQRTLNAMDGKLSPSGQPYTLKAESAALFGFRVTVFDPRQALYYRSFELQDRKRDASGILNRVARDPNAVTDEALVDAYRRAKTARTRAFTEMGRLVAAARASGMNDRAIFMTLRDSNIPERDAQALVRGAVPPWDLGASFMQSAEKKASVMFSEKERAEFQRRRQFLIRLSREERAQR